MNPSNRERILEAIDQLRRRKARPDGQRICNYLFRRFLINSAEAKADLEKCVEIGAVFRVEYKGSISYRNAARKTNTQQSNKSKKKAPVVQQAAEQVKIAPPANDALNQASDDNSLSNGDAHLSLKNGHQFFSQLLTNAIGELIVAEPDFLELGVPREEITANILGKDSVRYTEKYISILLAKEVECGGLIELEKGKYMLGRSGNEPDERPLANSSVIASTQIIQHEQANGGKFIIHVKPRKKPGPKPGTKQTKDERSASMDSDEKCKSENGGNLRVGGRRKRAKKVFDPSDSHIPKKRGRPAGSLNKATIEKQLAKFSDDSRPESRSSNGEREPNGVCYVCHALNKKGTNEKLITCNECIIKVHVSCLYLDDAALKTFSESLWQCPQCKQCAVCLETGNLLTCYVCVEGYHPSCHQPRVSENIKSTRWRCSNCEAPDQHKINEIHSSLSETLPSHSKHSNDASSNESSSSNSGNSSPANYNSPPLSPTPPQLSPQNGLARNGAGSDSQSVKDEDDDPDIDPSIPDATNWTAEEVYQYFAQYFPKEAYIFREQEIDGRSLLLMTRMDVLTNLKLKLGPALKIYRHVVKLQVRKDDPKYYWL